MKLVATTPLVALLTKVLHVILLLVAVAVLFVAREVFIPLALALLFSFLLAPVVTRLERWRLPRVLAVLLTTLLSLAVIGSIGYLVIGQVMDLTGRLSNYRENISRRISTLKSSGDGPLAKAAETFKQLGGELAGTSPGTNNLRSSVASSVNQTQVVPVELVEPSTNLPRLVQRVFHPLLGLLGTFTVIIVFVLFMLLKRVDLRDRLIHLIGRGQINVTTQALDEAATKVTGYLTVQVSVNVCFGLAVAVGLYFIGVPNPFLWGLLTTLLRFVPYLGAWIAMGFPLVLSLAVSDGWTMPVETVLLFAAVELVTGNLLEPWLYGAHTGLSPVAILVATIFWSWLWGGVGLLLATPLTVCLSVLGRYIPGLSFLGALLGDEPTLSAGERFYQRLLARNGREAGLVAEEYLQTHSLRELYSEVFVPVLAAAEREEESGTLDERQQRFIFQFTRELVDELGLETPVSEALDATEPHGNEEEAPLAATRITLPKGSLSENTVFCLPAAKEADEIVAVMLAQLLEREGYRAEALPCKTLANEMAAQVAEAGSTAVCISATSGHDTRHTRYLCKLLRARLPELHVVVGLWAADLAPRELERHRGRMAVDGVVTTISDALEQMRPLAALDARDVEPKCGSQVEVAAVGR